MSELFVMRRANGELFTEEIRGKLRIPVWSSEDALARYKERNPELMIFLPTRLTRSLIAKVRNRVGTEGTAEVLLLAEDAPDADMEDGKMITLEELLLGNEPVPQVGQMRS